MNSEGRGVRMKKYIVGIMVTMLLLSSCSTNDETGSEIVSPTVNEDISMESLDDINPTDEVVVEEESKPTIMELDLATYFNGMDGTAIFLTSHNQEYVYNQELLEQRYSPYSTFKIVSTLMGLEEGIVTSKNSTLLYDGSIYWYDLWNNNLNLEEAFQNSCVWYYHQIIYQMSQHTVQEYLDYLDYGNLDISQWEGTGNNPKADLNGFWLGSSLKISPREQVYLLKYLFEEETIFKAEHIHLVQELMCIDTANIYGKTGSGSTESWYVGYFELNNERVYFAIFIHGSNVSGTIAKNIAISLVENWEIMISNNAKTQNHPT